MMKNLFVQIKEGKIRKWMAIYVSTAITTFGVVHLLSIRYSWPNYIFDFVFFTILFGMFSTVIIAWFHGKEGRQKIKYIEIALHSTLFISLIMVLYFNINVDKNSKSNSNKKIIAVLPFTNINETSDSEFFADGMTDDVLTQLSKISDLKVISRTSVMKYKNTDLSIPEISRELGAGTILEGSVRTFGNKVRIVGQLIDANNDVHIWSETYDRELEDIFDIQSDIAERIAAALHAKLLPLEQQQINKKYTSNIDAYTYYLQGKHHYYNYTEAENVKAIKFFKKALEVDSNYALALAGLSNAYGQNVSKYWYPDEWIDSAMVFSKKALEINPDLAEGYKALASAYQAKEEFELALVNYQRAIKLNPNYWSAILNYGQVKTLLGNHDEAFYWIRRANELTPNDIFGNISVSMVYQNLNCDSSAIYWCKKALSLEPDHKFANSYLGDLYLGVGDFVSALKYFERSVKIDSNWIFGWFLGARIETVRNNDAKAKEYFNKYMNITESAPEFFYAHTLIRLNQIDSAMTILKEELKDYSDYFSETTYSQVNNYMAFAEIYALLNDKENSFTWWKEAIDNGYTDINRVKTYPYMNNIKGDARFSKILITMQTKIDSIKSEAKNKYPEYFYCN